jgi:hypothetical protein
VAMQTLGPDSASTAYLNREYEDYLRTGSDPSE